MLITTILSIDDQHQSDQVKSNKLVCPVQPKMAATTNGTPPQITLYTNHGCPYAQRAQIALKELDLKYEEVIIDLDTPRSASYLKINPVKLPPLLP